MALAHLKVCNARSRDRVNPRASTRTRIVGGSGWGMPFRVAMMDAERAANTPGASERAIV